MTFEKGEINLTNSRFKNGHMKASNEVNHTPTVATLFAGGGGDTLGFVSAGFNLVFANRSYAQTTNICKYFAF